MIIPWDIQNAVAITFLVDETIRSLVLAYLCVSVVWNVLWFPECNGGSSFYQRLWNGAIKPSDCVRNVLKGRGKHLNDSVFGSMRATATPNAPCIFSFPILWSKFCAYILRFELPTLFTLSCISVINGVQIKVCTYFVTVLNSECSVCTKMHESRAILYDYMKQFIYMYWIYFLSINYCK